MVVSGEGDKPPTTGFSNSKQKKERGQTGVGFSTARGKERQ